MAGKRIWVVFSALVFVIGGLMGGASGAPAGNRSTVASQTASGPSCRKCKRIVRKAKRCKAQNDDSARCKRAIRQARKCKKILRSNRCKKPSGGDGGSGGGGGSGSACPPYQPGEQGAGKPLSVVTDAATEEKPIEVTVTTAAAANGEPADTSKQFVNIQVDPAASDTGLWVRFEMSEGEDYDIYLNFSDGTEAASAGGFNPAPQGPLDGTGSGGHSETTAEQLDGIKSSDCQGYTLDMSSFNTPGGDRTLKLWLGEAKYTPGQ